MDLKEFANVDSLYRDIETGEKLTWNEYMERIINKLEINRIEFYIPYGRAYIKEALKTDVHLNNTDLRTWDNASGYMTSQWRSQPPLFLHRGFGQFLIDNKITCFSLSECVCILKETARILYKGE